MLAMYGQLLRAQKEVETLLVPLFLSVVLVTLPYRVVLFQIVPFLHWDTFTHLQRITGKTSSF